MMSLGGGRKEREDIFWSYNALYPERAYTV